MPARRDTRREAARVRRLSPLQTVEDQSQAWGICCHSCTWREGLAPSWRTELHSFWLCGLPEDLGPLSTNGSHFDICRVDHPVALRATPDRLHTCRCALHNAAFGRDQPSPLVTLDDLGDKDMAPWSQSGPSALARIHRITQGLPNGTDVGHQAIGAEQQWTVRGTAPHALDQAPDQR